MISPPYDVKVGDWIERDVPVGCSRWCKVISVLDEHKIQVVYLAGDNPIKDYFVWRADKWDFRNLGISGIKLRSGVAKWKQTLMSGPPHKIDTRCDPMLCYLDTDGHVWRLPTMTNRDQNYS